MSRKTACPLDCFDACMIDFSSGEIKADKCEPTSGFLCKHLNHYKKFEQIHMPRYKGEPISMDEALERLKEILHASKPNEVLHYRGSGNFGLMQYVTEHFFASYGATLTEGTLCDGAGEAGILEGRGKNENMSLEQIGKSEVVILWGRNPHATSSHLLPYIAGKKIIVIDPIKTRAAKEADLYLQIKPHGDLFLALLLARFLHIENGCDEAFLKEYARDVEDYYELTQSVRIKATLEDIGLSLGDIGALLSLVGQKRVAIVVGVGVQKYANGAEVMRAIDAFAAMLGLFGKEGCGVAYLGNSKAGIELPFNQVAKRVSKVDTRFENFKSVFVQGANPLSQMPDSKRVSASMQKVHNLVYFGLYENETSEMADLVIPAKNFLCKNDIRTSYSHNLMLEMPKMMDTQIGISEYELTSVLCKAFDIELKSESVYLEEIKSFSVQKMDGLWHVESVGEIAYEDGFEDEFVFLDEFDNHPISDEKLFLVTPKSLNSLNSQFKRESHVYLNVACGFSEGEIVRIQSEVGHVDLPVKLSEDVREDCVLIYSGTKGVNNLTTSKHAYGAKAAIFQELKVEVFKV